MGAFVRGLCVVACLSVSVLAIEGCSLSTLRVRLPGFGGGDVNGIWLWSEVSRGRFARACRIDISDPYVTGGREVVDYTGSCVDGRPSAGTWYSAVTRLTSPPGAIDLALLVPRSSTPRTYRASSFNEAGESALSTSTTRF